jgi:hypothetical protein
MSTSGLTKQAIIDLLEKNDEAVLHGLMAIYDRQTDDEQASHETKHDNAMGFNGLDAGIMSSFAEQVRSKGWVPGKGYRACKFLSPKQLALARKKLHKYAGQLLIVAAEKNPRPESVSEPAVGPEFVLATDSGLRAFTRDELKAELYPYTEG